MNAPTIPTIPVIESFGPWRNNAELIADCFTLGYLARDWRICDPTYGKGRFWTVVGADNLPGLVASDLNVDKSPAGRSIDFLRLPYRSGSFDATVFDGPYKLNGTPDSGGPANSDTAYGVDTAAHWQDRMELLRRGITSCYRVTAPHGYLLIKCQDQVCSGQIRWQTIDFANHAEQLGGRLVDMLHLRGRRPQPAGRRQVHSHRNYSTLLIVQKGRR